MKREFLEPEMEVVKFEEEDILTSSEVLENGGSEEEPEL